MAIKSQGAILAVGGAVSGTAVTATAATKASPCVVTATNTFVNGDIIVASTFVGMTQLNNRAFVASAVSSSSVALKGLDATNYGTYVSGGKLQKYVMSNIGQATDLKGYDGQAAEVDVTHLLSTAKEFLPGLQDFGTVSMTLWLDPADPGQILLRTAKEFATTMPFSLLFTDGTSTAFMAWVKQFTFDGVKPDGAISSSVVLRVTGAPAPFAAGP